MSIATGISAVKTGFDLVKGAVDILKRPEVDAHEVSARLLELQGLMLEAREALSGAQEDVSALKNEIGELKRMAAIGDSFTFDGGVYWYRDYPYCPNCWDIDRKPVRLDGPYGLSNSDWNCPIHKSKYYHKKYHQNPSF